MKQGLGGPTTVIDIAAHFYPEELAETAAAASNPVKDQHAGLDRKHDPETMIAEMQAGGVDAMVLSNPDYLGHDIVEETAHANDVLFDYVQEYDEFYGLAAIPEGASGEAAAAEFERCIDMGFHGGGLDKTHRALTDSEMEPVLEVADKTGAPILSHSVKLGNVKYRRNAIFGREHAHQESLYDFVHSGLFDRYPHLKIIWHHLGGNFASMLGRVHLQNEPGRWHEQDGMKSFAEFKRTVEDRVYIDTSGFYGYTAPIRNALEEFPSSQVLFGTDYPWEPRSSDDIRGFVDAVVESCSGRDACRVLGENALDVLVNT